MKDCAFRIVAIFVVGLVFTGSLVTSAAAANYNVAYSTGGTWNQIYAQGFSTSLGTTPRPA